MGFREDKIKKHGWMAALFGSLTIVSGIGSYVSYDNIERNEETTPQTTYSPDPVYPGQLIETHSYKGTATTESIALTGLSVGLAGLTALFAGFGLRRGYRAYQHYKGEAGWATIPHSEGLPKSGDTQGKDLDL